MTTRKAQRKGAAAARRPAAARAPLLHALSEAARRHSTATVLFHEAINARRGLSATEGKTLELLDRLGPLTASQLVAHSGLAPASVTELIDRLEARGFVRRERDDRDRRRVLVELIPASLADAGALFQRFRRSADTLWNEFSSRELEVIHRFLLRGAEFMRTAAEQLRATELPRGGDIPTRTGPAPPRSPRRSRRYEVARPARQP